MRAVRCESGTHDYRLSIRRTASHGSFWFAVVLFAFGSRVSAEPQPASPAPLTRIQDIRRLNSEEAGKKLPLRLKGTVTALSGWRNSFFLQDATGAISVDREDSAEVRPGDEVELSGVTGRGLFAPVALANHVEVIRHGAMPEPKRRSYHELSSGLEDSQWVSVRGVVREATISEGWGRRVLFLTLGVDGATITARVYSFAGVNPGALVNATVLTDGVCGTIFNDKRQLMGVRLFVPSLEQVHIEEAPPLDPFAVPALNLANLFQFAPVHLPDHRVKTEATVLYHDTRSNRLYLQAGKDTAIAEGTQIDPLPPGTRIEAVGFVSPGLPPVLQNSIVRQMGREALPQPTSIHADDVIQSKDGFTFAPFSGQLVQIEAQLVEKVERPGEQTWLLRDGNHVFRAQLGPGGNPQVLARIRDGSRVRLTGVCQVETDRSLEPHAFTLLVRSDADLILLQGSLWSGDRALWMIGLLIAIILGMSIWILQIRGALSGSNADAHRKRPLTIEPYIRYSRAAGLVCALIGGIVLAGGWGLQIAILRTLLPGQTEMKPNTAIGLLALGWALWQSARKSPQSRLWVNLCTIFTILLGGLTVAEYAWGLDLGIDQLLVRDPASEWFPGRVSLVSAISFVLMGTALRMIQNDRWLSLAQSLTLSVAAAAVLNLLGLLYGIRNIFGLNSHNGMAVHSSLAFLILCAGVLHLRSNAGLMATVTSLAPGGYVARRLLPAALLAPAILGWLRWQGELRGMYDTAFGLAIFTASNMIAICFLVWTSAGLLNRSDLERSLAEERVSESETRYRTVVESLPQLVWTCLPDGRCDYLNPGWAEYTGIPVEEQLGYAWTEQVHPNDRQPSADLWNEARQTGQKFDLEYRLRHSSGEYQWFRAVAVPLREAGGAITKWFGTSTNIESLKSREQSLRDSEARFRQIVDAMPQIIWTALPDGRIDYCNQRFSDYLGAPPERFHDWGWQAVLHPGDLAVCMERWTRSLDTGEAYEFEGRFKRASDDAYRWHLVRALPTRGSSGTIVRWFGTATDIEDYKIAQQTLAGWNENLEGLIDRRTSELQLARQDAGRCRRELDSILTGAAQIAIISTDSNGLIRLFSTGAENMLQYRSSEVTGNHSLSLIHVALELEERSKTLSRNLGRTVQGLETVFHPARENRFEEQEWTFVRKDGSAVEVALAVTAIDDSAGYLIVATDITRRKSRERQLRRCHEELADQTIRAESADRAKSEFLASVSHEIRTPMNAILGMAALLWETDLTADQRKYVEVFRRAGSNLLMLINDILDLSKVEAGQFELEHIAFDLEDVIHEVIELMKPKAAAKGLVLLCRISPHLATGFIGDPARTRQVLVNLLGNALKFTDWGEVVLSVRASDNGKAGHLEFSVADTGIGIAPDKLKAIFEDFTQGDSSFSRRHGGTGLGLSIGRRIVERMGGNFTVTSAVGRGSTFRFTAVLEPDQEQKRRFQPDPNEFAGKRVLIFDENATNRMILRETLGAWGLETTECATPEAALQALSVRSFSAAVLDNHMPAMSGFALAAAIREASLGVPIIMFSGDTRPADQARRVSLSLSALAVRPIKRADVLQLLRKVLKPVDSSSSVPPKSSTATVSQLRILIAEDSSDNQLLLQAYLKGSPYELKFVDDGQAAVDDFAEGNSYDLILMDMQMPRMDGLTATRAIRSIEQERRSERIPILALTANVRPQDMEASREAGCDTHLSKPISKNNLIHAIEEFGRKREAATAEVGGTRIAVPAGLEDLAAGYLERRTREVAEMLVLLENANFERLGTLGHDLKGSGSSYGFPEVSRLGAELEAAATRTDHDAVALGIAKLADYLSRLQLVKS